MNVLRIFLTAVAALFGGIALGGLATAVAGHWIIGGALVAAGAPLAWIIFGQAQRYTVQSTAEQEAQFEEAMRALAAKNGGVAAISAIVQATGFSRDRAELRMRALVARGVCELDFSETGEVQYRLTPTDEARAQLAAMRDKTT